MKILYICTHNRCRSIMAEAISNQLGQGRIEARSAGSQPQGQVHPLALQYLQRAGYSCAGLRSKSWDELEDFQPDLIVTLCDSAAGEPCPAWFGASERLHWGMADPSRVDGDDQAIAAAFDEAIAILEQRVHQLREQPGAEEV